jgi:hypothetical protein
MMKGHPLRAKPDSLSDLGRPQLDDGAAQSAEIASRQCGEHEISA